MALFRQDLVQRDFVATRPDQLRVAELTYVAILAGFAHAAFVIVVSSRRIVGRRVSRAVRSDLALYALEQAACARRAPAELVHRSERGVQHLSIKHTERLAEAGIEPSAGSVGDAHGSALPEPITAPH